MSDFSKLRQLGERATPPPWWYDVEHPGPPRGVFGHVYSDDGWIAETNADEKADEAPDADFIRVARNLWPALVDVVEAGEPLEKLRDGDPFREIDLWELQKSLGRLRAEMEKL